jgi:hypothetical protein
MVLLKPLLADERIRVCAKCSHIGIESPVRERSSFNRRRSRGRVIFCARCRVCEGTAKAAAHRKRRNDPVRGEEIRRQERKWLREYRQMQRLLEREKRGQLPIANTPASARTNLHYPARPIAAIVARLVLEAQENGVRAPEEAVACRMRMSAKRMSDLLERLVLDEIQVDKVATAVGLRIEDLYPLEVRELAEANRVRMRRGPGGGLIPRFAPAREVLAWLSHAERVLEGWR